MHVDFSAFDLDPQTRQLLRQERFEFEAVLGTAVRFTTSPVRGPQWVAVQDDDAMPSLSWDPDTPTLTSRARDQAQLMSTLQLLQTLAHSRTHHVEAVPAPSVDGATDMLHTEVANTFTSLRLRGLDWEAITCTALGSAPTTWGGLPAMGSHLGGTSGRRAHNSDRPPNAHSQPALHRGTGGPGGQVSHRAPASAAHSAGVRRGGQ